MIRPKKSGVWPSTKKNLNSTFCEFWKIRISASDADGDGGVGAPGAVLLLAARAGRGGRVCHSVATLPTLGTKPAPRVTRGGLASAHGDASRTRGSAERGQATPEYVGLVLLVAALLAGLLALAGPALPGGALARAVAAEARLRGRGGGVLRCARPSSRRSLAARAGLRRRARGDDRRAALPEISFEDDDFVSLPGRLPRVPRSAACADSVLHGSLEHTQTGLEPAAFVHVVDCRDAGRRGAARATTARARAPATSTSSTGSTTPRAGRRAYQRWGYPRRRLGELPGADRPGRRRAAPGQLPPQLQRPQRRPRQHRQRPRLGAAGRLGQDPGQLHVAAGSHAGMTAGRRRRQPPRSPRQTCGSIPLEPIAAAGDAPPSRSRRRGRRRSGATRKRRGPESDQRARRIAAYG